MKFEKKRDARVTLDEGDKVWLCNKCATKYSPIKCLLIESTYEGSPPPNCPHEKGDGTVCTADWKLQGEQHSAHWGFQGGE